MNNAWQIHSALQTWTSNVDSKASFVLGIETIVATAVITTTTDDGPLATFHGWRMQGLFVASIVLLFVAAVLCVLVVAPKLRVKSMDSEKSDNFVYFGHVRHWKQEELESALEQRAFLPVLSRQLVEMSKIAWIKHRHLAFSIWIGLVGAVLGGLAVIIN
ncbi:Pycsar system effector family protein [Cumulibacter manganitolerans]|uniref:Pycsar system effector family protein n=1 Tax=Cumulibacter manganitolerans TaxID=1884992 RepID=UPI001295E873|nr:Pycsar system effector family protein [Cumulibacter manganitolerans]